MAQCSFPFELSHDFAEHEFAILISWHHIVLRGSHSLFTLARAHSAHTHSYTDSSKFCWSVFMTIFSQFSNSFFSPLFIAIVISYVFGSCDRLINFQLVCHTPSMQRLCSNYQYTYTPINFVSNAQIRSLLEIFECSAIVIWRAHRFHLI